MIRTLAIAATAAALLAAPASAETSVRISTVGKSAAQLKLEVTKAAETLCRNQTRDTLGYLAGYTTCVQASVQDALIQTPALKVASK
jgi:hypothetical protein